MSDIIDILITTSIILGVWTVVGFVVGIAVARFIAAGKGGDDDGNS